MVLRVSDMPCSSQIPTAGAGCPVTSLYKPTPPHNHLLAPAICMCVECSRLILALRCPVLDVNLNQCGDYKGHRGAHSLIVATCFDIAAERVAP